MSENLFIRDTAYRTWLEELKKKIRNAQLKASITVNRELLLFYWELGADIVSRQAETKWGEGLFTQLSTDLIAEFPDMKGFSVSNLRYIRQWFLFFSEAASIHQQAVGELPPNTVFPPQHIESFDVTSNALNHQQAVGQLAQQVVAQITSIPWGHNIAIIAKCKKIDEALYYVQQTIENNWSRSVLVHQIESGLFQRDGKAVSNFAITLPQPQSDLAQQTLKDPYIFDFLTMTKAYDERDLEKGLVDHIAHFLMELGAGFAYIGRQYPLHVGKRDFFIDLLFYHTHLHCYVVVELKTVEFEPEHTGKLNFYIKAVDEQLRKEGDAPSIGILLCKSKDKMVAEYALSDIHKPMGVSEYHLTQSLPEELKGSLPSIEEIERELSNGK